MGSAAFCSPKGESFVPKLELVEAYGKLVRIVQKLEK